MTKRYDIVVPKKYQKDGEEKTSWKNVGTLVHFPATEQKEEGYIMELNMYPEVTFKVFAQKTKEERESTTPALHAGYMSKKELGEDEQPPEPESEDW